MTGRGRLWVVLVVIAGATALTGLVQCGLPGLVLGLVGAEQTPTSRHFFAIVGMFMLLFGGVLLQALLLPRPDRLVLLWAGLQKVGAAAAVGLGVARGIFGTTALLVALFDLASGVLIFAYRQAIGPGTEAGPS